MGRNIELPDKLYEDAQKKRKQEDFHSVSEAIRYLVRRWTDE